MLLNKGLKYNLSHKRKQWISNLAFEAETATTLLPPGELEYIFDTKLHITERNCTNNRINDPITVTYRLEMGTKL